MAFLTVSEAADVARCHPERLTEAARRGKLHGYQRSKWSTWKFEEGCVESWVRGEKCVHRVVKKVAA
jgi:hypothetical protein